MIYVSYYGNYRKFPLEFKTVSISRFVPKYMKVDVHAIELAPSQKLLNDYKSGKVDEQQYIEIFKKEILGNLNPSAIQEKYDNCILLCYEKTGDFCHRTLVKNWLNELNIECREL